jgi:hypothetical protein
MPLPLAPLLGFALGVAFAWVARAEIARVDTPLYESRSLRVVLGFAAMVFAPMEGYFAAFHGDWAYLYLVPWRRVPSAFDLALVALAGAAVIGGFFAASPLARARKIGPLGALFAAPVVVLLLAMLALQRRLGTSGTFAQFQGGFGTESVTRTDLGRGLLSMLVVLALGVGWCVRLLRRDARRRAPNMAADVAGTRRP